MVKDCKLVLNRKDFLFFTYCVISDMFTGLIQFLPAMT